MDEGLLLRKRFQLALSDICVFKLASLNAVPNSYFNFETTGDFGEKGGVEGEERRFEKTKHLGVFL